MYFYWWIFGLASLYFTEKQYTEQPTCGGKQIIFRTTGQYAKYLTSSLIHPLILIIPQIPHSGFKPK